MITNRKYVVNEKMQSRMNRFILCSFQKDVLFIYIYIHTIVSYSQ
jgi:hypothetical protein